MSARTERRSPRLARLADALSARPGMVVGVSLALALLASTQLLRIEVSTSRTNLGHPANDAERDFGHFLEQYGSPNDLIAVIEAVDEDRKPDPARLREAADALAQELAADEEHVRSTFHKIDVEFFLRRIMLFVPAPDLPQIHTVLSSTYADDIRAGKVDGLPAIVDELTSAFAGRAGFGAAPPDPERAAPWLDAVTVMIRELDARLRDPTREGFEGLRDLIPPLKAGAIDDAGYLQSRDGRLRVLFIRPTVRSDENSVVLPMVEEIRHRMRAVEAQLPGLRLRLTGLPALQADESVIVDRDMVMTTVVSLLAITIILLYGYRKPQQVLLSLVPLVIGIAWTMAIVRFTYGRINLVASIFMPILLGRGSDFAIYVIARFNAERAEGASPREAVRRVLSAAGPGIVTGALLTSAAFFVATIGQFGTFEELGVVVGVGLVMVLLASVVVTPALLLLVGERRLPGELTAERWFEALPRLRGGPGMFSLRHPIPVLLVTAVLVAVLGASAWRFQFDFDLLKFLPRRAESAAAQRELSARSDYGADVVVVTTSGVDEAREKAAALAALPNVGRVESIASFLPSDQQSKLQVLRTLRPAVESLPPFTEPVPATTPAQFAAALRKLSDEIDDKVFLTEQAAAGNAKLEPLAAQLKKLAAAVNDAIATLGSLPPPAAQRAVSNIEHQIFSLLISSRQLLRDNVLDAREVRIDELPRATLERFVGKRGGSAVFVFPRKPGAGPELDAFVKDVRSVAPHATGFPIIYYESSRSALHSFLRAALQALAVIVLALILHFRSLLAALLALVPLLLAAIAMGGLMRILGMEHNMANIVALPLLIGLGTDYGLQIMHHVHTHPGEALRVVLSKTGLGVFMAGATTAAGFGALALAQHLGGRSLGLELFLGTTAALVCALVVLPALLALIYRE